MDIHETAFSLYAQIVGRQDLSALDDAARMALGREAYKLAEAFIAAKDVYIRELPASYQDATF